MKSSLNNEGLSMGNGKVKNKVNSGWTAIEILGVLAVIIIASAGAITLVYNMFSSNSTTTELSNVQHLATQTRGLMKSKGGYEFTSASTMTGTLIRAGGTSNMTINGDASSGSATLSNDWGGDVLITPEKVGGSINNKGFSVTYKNVPQEACTTLVTKLSESGVSETSISGTNNIGSVSPEQAGSQCQNDTGSTGNNTIIWKFNN
jgi:type II secretory pathway pseudopilin PulG